MMVFTKPEIESGQPQPRKRPWLAPVFLCALVVAVVVLLVVILPNGSSAPTHPVTHAQTSVAVKPPTSVVPWTPALGVYAGPGDLAGDDMFSMQLGGSVPYALDFIQGANWLTIADPQWTVQHWTGSTFHMIFGVPMLPTSGASLAAGAVGFYDPFFTSLATQLVADGEGQAVLMIGWNPLQAGTSWQVTNQAEAAEYVTYWQHIVTTMRAVPGADFQMEWDGGTPVGPLSPAAVYPGDSFVNLIAANAFDRVLKPTSGSRFYAVAQGAYGLDWFSEFAAKHDKPLVIGEWGLVPQTTSGGGGDDASFVRQLLAWCRANRVAMAVTWNYDQWQITSGAYPASEAILAQAASSGPSSAALAELDSSADGT